MMTREKSMSQNKEWSIDDFNKWRDENSAELEAAFERNQRAVDSIVIKDVMLRLELCLTLEEVCDSISRHYNGYGNKDGVLVTEAAVKRSLKRLSGKAGKKTDGG